MSNPIYEWCKAERGRQKKLAEALGVTQGLVSHYCRGKKLIGPAKVIPVENFTGISRHVLRPDIFGPAPNS